MPMHWLDSKTHELKANDWGYISLSQVLDKLKTNLESIVDQSELIYDESFMMRIMTEFANKLPPFKDFLTRKFENQQTKCFASSFKTVPLKEWYRELFYSTDQDNKDNTFMMEHLTAVASQAWIDELMDSTKGT